MTNAMREYYSGRELAERTAAERAASELARDIHLQLADRYAALARDRDRLSIRFQSNATENCRFHSARQPVL